jgi:hypothetical protein
MSGTAAEIVEGIERIRELIAATGDTITLCGRICLRPCQIGHVAVREGVAEGGVRLGG